MAANKTPMILPKIAAISVVVFDLVLGLALFVSVGVGVGVATPVVAAAVEVAAELVNELFKDAVGCVSPSHAFHVVVACFVLFAI
jgi:hypothetical protein